jgi:stage V sporulation protein G
MKITEVRVFPTKSRDGRLKAYATMTFDDWFVVRNVKIIQGNTGPFVAMPSRKIMDPCKKCGFKNVRGSKFCNDCGTQLHVRREDSGDQRDKKQNDHMDIAHPIRQACRVYIQEEILKAFDMEMERKEKEGDNYKPATTDDFDRAQEGFEPGNEAPRRHDRDRDHGRDQGRGHSRDHARSHGRDRGRDTRRDHPRDQSRDNVRQTTPLSPSVPPAPPVPPAGIDEGEDIEL